MAQAVKSAAPGCAGVWWPSGGGRGGCTPRGWPGLCARHDGWLGGGSSKPAAGDRWPVAARAGAGIGGDEQRRPGAGCPGWAFRHQPLRQPSAPGPRSFPCRPHPLRFGSELLAVVRPVAEPPRAIGPVVGVRPSFSRQVTAPPLSDPPRRSTTPYGNSPCGPQYSSRQFSPLPILEHANELYAATVATAFLTIGLRPPSSRPWS